MSGIVKLATSEIAERAHVFELIAERFNSHLSGCRELDHERTTTHPRMAYPCIPLSFSHYSALMLNAREVSGKAKPRMLDVGCGPGVTVTLARKLLGYHDDSMGIELNKKYNISLSEGQCKYGVDAFDYEDYDKFDVIYCYNIIPDTQVMRKLFHTMLRKARPNVVWALPMFTAYDNLGIGDKWMGKSRCKVDHELHSCDNYQELFKGARK